MLLAEATARRDVDSVHAIPGLRLSASVGWADAETHGHDLDAMLAAAHTAALVALERGGDQWVRAAEPGVSETV